MTLRFTDSSKVGYFGYDLGGCAIVNGLSKEKHQIIDMLFVAVPA